MKEPIRRVDADADPTVFRDWNMIQTTLESKFPLVEYLYIPSDVWTLQIDPAPNLKPNEGGTILIQ